MGMVELFLIAVGLSMDAFAVAVCKGLSIGKIKWKHMCMAGLWFGGFQALMPALGYFLGNFFTDLVQAFSHWIAFVLLVFIGANMIKESRERGCDCCSDADASMDVKTMFLLAVATSIDALAVGVSFAFMKVQIAWAVLFIGVITFVLSAIGVKFGSFFGTKYKSKAEFIGGLVLILIGTKTLLEGLGVLG